MCILFIQSCLPVNSIVLAISNKCKRLNTFLNISGTTDSIVECICLYFNATVDATTSKMFRKQSFLF